jgi:hypothetical protein
LSWWEMLSSYQMFLPPIHCGKKCLTATRCISHQYLCLKTPRCHHVSFPWIWMDKNVQILTVVFINIFFLHQGIMRNLIIVPKFHDYIP